MAGSEKIADLEKKLNDFDLGVRTAALAELLELALTGAVRLAPESPVANMHCHTFFSFNAFGHSPSSLVWLARKHGIRLLGTVDFDVLDGVEEFLSACEKAAVRGSAGIETRAFVPEYADRVINSPGEPGVCYLMGIGFTSGFRPEETESLFYDLRERAAVRNRELIKRINTHLESMGIDYEEDVLPLTPSGNATERHIIAAYARKAENGVAEPAAYWSSQLDVPQEELGTARSGDQKFLDLLRTRLIKRGGIGYVRPNPGTFPPFKRFFEFVTSCGALPCAAWLDGTSEGEKAIKKLLELFIGSGVAALNIIPDRNWNIRDSGESTLKIRNLYSVVELSARLDLPLNIGTEMNSYGQRVVDDFGARELAPVKQAFLDGAHFIYGHTMLERVSGLGYQSDWTRAHLPSRRERNVFYTHAGSLIPPGRSGRRMLEEIDEEFTPFEVTTHLERHRADR